MVKKVNIPNVVKFQSPFERPKLYTTSSDITLRKAIITQAIIDATNIAETGAGKRLKKEAKFWIFENNESFKTICNEAGIESSFVVRITKSIITLHKDEQSKIRK